ncbi:MAG: transcription-repair coupling factor [Bacteroidaceae bacterium]|nr:transcription-repair coupling factor [Bacteroidaceae bacterium]
MQIEELVKLYTSHAGVKAFEKTWEEGSRSIFLRGLVASSPALFFSALVRSGSLKGCPAILFTLRDAEEAGYFYHDLTQLLGEQEVLFFPSSYKRAIKYRQKDDAAEVLRTEVLTRLSALTGPSDNHPLLIVSSPNALAEGVVTQQNLQENTLHLSVGQTIDATDLTNELFRLGFRRTGYVYEPGQYAVRGSIVDVFSFSSEFPFRIDFFGDDIDSIRTFEVESQLSRSKADDVYITPELTAQEQTHGSFFDFLPQTSALVFRDYLDVCDIVDTIQHDSLSIRIDDSEPSTPPVLISKEDFMRTSSAFRRIEFGTHPTGTPQATVSFDVSVQPIFHKNFDFVSSSFTDYISRGYRLYVLSDSSKQCERLRTIFDERGEWDNGSGEEGRHIHFIAINKTLHEGFADNTLRCCFFTDHQIFDRFHKYSLRSDKARQGKVAVSLKELAQFEIGDYIVHIDHGIGRFAGLVRIPNGDSTQEAIKLIYEGSRGGQDVVLVSIHSLHKISKYKGKEGVQPRMSRLGTGAWEKMKERTKTKIKDIARDLILLYSKRLKEPGFAFSPDSFLQHELEAGFIYEDTPDQLKATQEVKADMERTRPMDRLICGDVGFGKTEVAIRAAFKACADSKQVAVLVPTTVLAYQHFQTFSERLRDFPCRVDYLSRARSAHDIKAILSDLAEGKIDIIIGTHKLIGKSVRFKDLGLLIIDEEQKFGVSVKERLKQMKVNVDTLTLTATPIPRTLQFSLMGARDLSIMQTPPANRYPIQTEVHTFNEDIIRDAINYEMSRSGQTFFINNRVQNLPELAALVKRLVPDARVAIGHGQMEPEQLENIILGFINYDYDVLIATSIIENGIDIPNANTILINQAHMFGLSDLHQMRGRVGRTNRRAFCYLLAPPYSSMTDEAHRRLVAIENFTDLGSGIHIAMQDLDIRGAGNLLGAEQSGFIADLGYETYQKILEEAVHELKTDEFTDLFEKASAPEDDKATGTDVSTVFTGEDFVQECAFESDLELLFPDEYIPSSGERILIYRELDSLTTDEQLAAFRTRLEDRFGHIPHEGEELMKVVPLRRIARSLGIEKIVLKAGRMVLYFVGTTDSPYYQSASFGRVLAFSTVCPNDCQFRQTGARQNLLIHNVGSVAQALDLLKRI